MLWTKFDLVFKLIPGNGKNFDEAAANFGSLEILETSFDVSLCPRHEYFTAISQEVFPEIYPLIQRLNRWAGFLLFESQLKGLRLIGPILSVLRHR